MPDSLNACGFVFKNIKDAEKAVEEEKRIKYIKEHLDYSQPESVLVIYNKMLKNKIFETPVGYSFLMDTRNFLLSNRFIDDANVSDISVNNVFVQSEAYDVRIPVKKKASKGALEQLQGKYRTACIAAITMAVMVVIMFVITMKSDNPNILNYKTALENKYASWDQELNERERAVKLKEAEFNIDNW